MSKKNIADIIPLSPAQEGMLYETIRATVPGIYIEQSMYTFTGMLDVGAFEQAWQSVIDRHAILRTSFVWKELKEPLQVTQHQVSVPLTYQDWRGHDPEELQARVDEAIRQERTRGFELSRPPLMRLQLVRLDEQTYHFLWTFHHIILDGWSVYVLIGEVIDRYRALSNGHSLSREASRPYSDYMAWLKRQDVALAEQFWRKTLGGLTQPTLLGREQEPAETYAPQEWYGTAHIQLSEETSAALGRTSQRHRMTLSTIMQGAWALLLRCYSGSQDVVLGITVSGRPAELAGVETMVGPFFNTLPLRVQVPPHVLLWPWLQDIQRHTVEMHAYEYSSAGQVHQWSEVAGRFPLYESILVVENYPIGTTTLRSGKGDMEVTAGAPQGAQTTYALTILVTLGSRVGVQVVYNTSRFEGTAVDQMLTHFHQCLSTIATDPEVSIETMCSQIVRDEIPIVYPARRVEEEDDDPTFHSPLEEVIASVWGEVLGLAQVGRQSHFFALGGHSLLAIQLLARVRTNLRIEVPLRMLFEEPTVAGFARRVEQLLRKGEGRLLPPLVAGSRPETLPLSYAQQRLWFLDQLEPGSTTYLVPSVLRLQGRLEAQHLEQALEELINRHENLRTTFEERSGQPVQVIHPSGPYTFPVIDLQGIAQERQTEEVQRLVSQDARLPCDLAQGPLLRITLLRLERETHILLQTLHHSITDGWSSGIFVRELTTLYRSLVTGQPSPLAPLPIQYADYALWQRGWLHGEVLEAHLAYWRKQLAEVPPLKLPTDAPSPANPGSRGARYAFSLPTELFEELMRICRLEGVTMFMLLLAAFQVLLARLSGQDDIVVGTDVANRNQIETEGLIGFFVNQLVLRSRVVGHQTFRTLLQQVRNTTLDAYLHQDVPFEKLVEKLRPERDGYSIPFFRVRMLLQPTFPKKMLDQDANTISALTADAMPHPLESAAKVDLTLRLLQTSESMQAAFEYRADLFEAATIARMAQQFLTLLKSISMNQDGTINGLEIFSEQEQLEMEKRRKERETTLSTKLKNIHPRSVLLPRE